jgi:osmoprotectant transport system substrate-binding protein
VAEIYAQGLEGAGVHTRRELDLGPRELVSPALRQGLVDVVPEYLGSGLAALIDETVDARLGPEAVRRDLAAALERWDVEVLRPAAAQNRNVFVMDASFAARHGVRHLSDLVPLASQLTLAGPAECPNRHLCLQGLRDVYGLHFGTFVEIQGPAQGRRALEDDVAQVVVMFETDGQLADPDLVVLDDDRTLQPAENLVPLVRAAAVDRHGVVVVRTLDRISQELTGENLRFLNWRVSVAGGDPAAEARGWLLRHEIPAG